MQFTSRRLFAILGILFLLQISARSQQADKPDVEAITKKKTAELLEKAKDEYRIYFKKPTTGIEYWAAIQLEMDLGKFDLASLHLEQLLNKEPKADIDKELIKLEQSQGMSAFFRLKHVREWSDHPPLEKKARENVEKLIDRVTAVVESHLSDPQRIQKFMKQLVADTEEERAFAYVQLSRSRERAVPYLVEGLRVEYGKPLYNRYREMLLRMGEETVPVYLEIFKAANEKDFRDIEPRLTLLDIVHRRGDKRVIPYLWHMSSSKQYPDAIRKKAKEVLAAFLKLDEQDLPSAKETLTAMAESFYKHKGPFVEGKPIPLWTWNGESISLRPLNPPLTRDEAEELFGLRYALQALDLDPTYQPAQIVLLNLRLDRQFRQRVDQILLEPLSPKMHHLLTTLDADLLLRVMDRAMEDHQIPVILPIMQVLGERGEYRAIRLNASGQPGGITRGLYYPDRRVQMAAMKAMLQMPSSTTLTAASGRIVELARRFVAAGPTPKALVAYTPMGQQEPVRGIVKALGYEPVLANRIKEAIEQGRASADFDLVVLHHGMSDLDFPHIYAQLRKDVDLGGLPMVVIVEKNREKSVRKLAARDSNVLVVVDGKFQADEEMKDLLDKQVRNVQFAKLSPAERRDFSFYSMAVLWRMARGELPGYDVMPALEVIKAQLRSPENAILALEILGRLPGKEIQYSLAGIVTDVNRGKLRLPAAMELNRHIQKNGLQLDAKQLDALKIAFRDSGEDPLLRKELTVTVSLFTRPSPRQTGAQLSEFRPDPPGQPMPKGKEKEKEEK